MFMNMWKRMAPFERRELYYFDTTGEFEAAEMAARLYLMIKRRTGKAEKKRDIIFVHWDRSFYGRQPGTFDWS